VYEPGRPIEEVAREAGLDPGRIVKLASNENALGPSPKAVAAMVAAAAGMHRYPDGGAFHLRRALAAHLGTAPDQILPGNGSNELIELLGRLLLGPGKNAVMADRAFVVYRLVAAAMGADVIDVPMRDHTHDLDAMLSAVTRATSLVFIGNPNNPTGTMVGGREIDRFMDRVPGHVVVCFDEAYIELLPPERRPDALKYVREGRNAVCLRTFSKTYGLAGLRIGYAVAPSDCVQMMNRVRQPFNVNAMALSAALAALEDREHVVRTQAMVQDGLRQLEEGLRVRGVEFIPSVVNFMMVRTGNGRSVFTELMKLGVIVRPVDGYGMPEYIRVSVGTREENSRFLVALDQVIEGGGGRK
jgi:histidinol-phosphate aminotransferase